ncbi:MAG: HlyD family secretion protein [Bacteroidaceae bacterium]|nr:HlyD family secretion protein [Bacteroidaceae bacterium]
MDKKKALRIAYNLIIVALLLSGAYLVIDNFVHFGQVEHTDNAHVRQHITPVNTRVQGFIKEICFKEFQPVKKGDTLVVIEDTEFRLRLAQAEADLVRAEAGSRATTSGMTTTQTHIGVTEAGIEEARVRMENARREEERYARLLQEDAVTPQQYDQVHTAYLAAQARHEQMQRQRQSLSSVKTEQGHHLSQNAAAVQVARAAVDLARLQLSYTVIVATADGVVGRKEIHEGQLVQPGQTMVDIVDSSDLWVVANYRETQMQHIAVGSKVKVTVDAIPGVEFEGIVESISEATGSAFSIIPQDNATGNFVKVEQRLPVRIRLTDHEALPRLRAGMNAECEVAY